MIRTLFFSKSKAPNFFEIVVHYFQIKRSPKCALFGIKCEKLRQSLGFTPSCGAYDAPHRPTSCLHATRNRTFGPFVLAVTPLGRSSRLCLTSMVACVKRIFVGDDAKFKIVGTWTIENADKTAKNYNVLLYF